MDKSVLLNKLNTVRKISNFSKIRRFAYNPYKYFFAMFYRKFVYPRTQKEKILTTNLFWDKKMIIALPASTDIYLTGGKSHSSEIRLARFIINNLKESNHFLDIGAHFGYFTLLASEIVGISGKVLSFEPTSKSYELLELNITNLKNTEIFQKAVSNLKEPITFYEFPNLHSEYNTSDVTQFENESWFINSKPQKVTVQTTTIDNLTEDKGFIPTIIKIDVEGAEFNVINGGLTFLKNNNPLIVMEYLEPKRKNDTHKKALELLLSLGYYSYLINNEGGINPIMNIDHYLETENLESDNIVFRKGK